MDKRGMMMKGMILLGVLLIAFSIISMVGISAGYLKTDTIDSKVDFSICNSYSKDSLKQSCIESNLLDKDLVIEKTDSVSTLAYDSVNLKEGYPQFVVVDKKMNSISGYLLFHDSGFIHNRDKIRICLSSNTANPLQDLKFRQPSKNGSLSYTLKDFSEKIESVRNESYLTDIDDFGLCNGTSFNNHTNLSESFSYACITGSHKEVRYHDVGYTYNPLETYPAGCHDFWISAVKGQNEILDYVIVSGGKDIERLAVWNNTFNVGLRASYNFSDNTSAVNPGLNNLISVGPGGTIRTAGAFPVGDGKSIYFAGNGCMIPITPSGDIVFNFTAGTNATVNFWVNNSGNSYPMMGKGARVGGPSGWDMVDSDGGITLQFRSSVSLTSTLQPANHRWQMITMTNNATDICFYVNGTLSNCYGSQIAGQQTTANFTIGCTYDGGYNYFTGWIDEVLFYNITLSSSQINDLWNNSYGMTWQADSSSPPTISIAVPANNSNFNYMTNVNYTATDDIAVDSCWWTKDAGITNTSVTCGTNITGQTWAQGSTTVAVYANDSSNGVGTSQVTFNIDTIFPSVSIAYPANATYNVNVSALNFTYSDTNAGSCWYSRNGGTTNSSANLASTNFTSVTSAEGNNIWNIYCNDTFGNLNLTSSVTFFKDTILPNGTLISPSNGSTTFLLENNFTANLSDTNLKNATLFIYNSSNSLINQTTTIFSGVTNTIIGTVVKLANGVYTWFYEIFDVTGNSFTTSNSTLTINALTTNISSGYYGMTLNRIMNSSDISSSIQFGYEMFETTANATLINSSWGNVLDSINQSYVSNKKMGLNYLLDFNLNNSAQLTAFNNNITSNFPTLKTDPYYATIEYLSLEISNPDYYNASQKNLVMNSIASTIYSATSNKFVLYSKNYNSTGLDTSYITPTQMIYITASSDADLINQEMAYAKNTTNLNRMYVNPASTQQTITASYHSNVLKQLRAGLNLSIGYGQVNVAGLTNGDIIVFNNGSSQSVLSVNATNMTASGKDLWDTINKLQVAKNFNGQLLNVNVSGYSATYVLSDDIDHILMTTISQSTLYKSSSTSTSSFNYSDGTRDGSWSLYGANDMRIELFDSSYQRNNFMTYYGWINASYINFSSVYYPVLIIADKNAGELARINPLDEKYGYISVADFADTGAWVTSKEGEVDNWISLNETMNVFIDGLDSGIGGNNFSARFKEVVDYARITKDKKVILNTYTAYESFATWGDGAMKESCVQRWNGADAGSPTNYSREDWNLELNKSTWYNSHGVAVYCQAFGNRTTNPYQVKNYTEVVDVFYASKVLGYNSFYFTQPDFNYAWTEYLPNVGTSMASTWSTSDNQTYSRRYSNGIVYYNSSSGHGWQDTGSTTNNVQICFDLYDEHANAVSFDFNINHNDGTPPVSGDYSISDTQLSIGSWTTVCKTVNASENGRYVVDGFVNPRNTIVAQGLSIGYAEVSGNSASSWWDNTAGAYSWNIYPMGRNWEVSVVSNSTSKASLDTLTSITATYVNATYYRHNLTISSSNEYNFTTISSLQQTNTLKAFKNISYKNATGSIFNLNALNTTTCDSNNPSMSSVSVNSETFGACYQQDSSSIKWRVQMPHLSTQDFVMETDYDVTSPSLSVAYPANTTYTINVSALNYSVADPNIHACWYSLNSGVTNTTITCGTNATGLTSSEGSNIWKVWANDSFGNINSSSVTFFKDSIQPAINFTNPTEASGSSLAVNYIKANLTSSDTNFANLTIYLYNSTRVLVNSSFKTASPFNHTFTGLANGVYYLNATATDIFGNQNSTETRTITIYVSDSQQQQQSSGGTSGGYTLSSSPTSDPSYLLGDSINITLHDMMLSYSSLNLRGFTEILIKTVDVNGTPVESVVTVTNKGGTSLPSQFTRQKEGIYDYKFIAEQNVTSYDFRIVAQQGDKSITKEITINETSGNLAPLASVTNNAKEKARDVAEWISENWIILSVLGMALLIVIAIIAVVSR